MLRPPLAVYLDQNALSNLANMATDWKASELGKLLINPGVEPWVSPVHCLEIAQTTDATVRARLAHTALELAAFRRVLPAYEFIVATTFAEWLQLIAPGAVRGWQYLRYHQEDSHRTMLAMLALMAMQQPVAEGPLEEILKGKFGTQELHAAAISDPGTWIRRLLECTDKILVEPRGGTEELDGPSVEDLRKAASEIAVGPGISQELRKILNKRRRAIARAYGAVEIGACIVAAMTLPLDVNYTFDAEALKAKWKELHQAAGTSKVPLPDLSHGIWTLLAQLTYALARGKGLLPATLANEAIIREVEHFAAKKERANSGVLFDGDHAVYLCLTRVFISDDEDLRAALRPLAELVKEETGAQWKSEVVSSEQAVSAIRRLTA
jgi:hypothetical protein